MTEREIDVAYALEDVRSVAGVYALDGAPTLDLAVVLRPKRGDTVAEAHYRLLTVLTHEECGRVLFIDGDLQAPALLGRARRLGVPAAARAGAQLRSLARVEQIAKCHLDERLEMLRSPPPLVVAPAEPQGGVTERAIDVAAALEAYDPATVYLVERREAKGETTLEVFVELLPYTAATVIAAHERVLSATHGAVRACVIYGNAEQRARHFASRQALTPFDRWMAQTRAGRRAIIAAPVALSAERVAAAFSAARPTVLALHGDAVVGP
jgi:hypothetical protein